MGPANMNTPIGMRTALTKSNRCRASSKPRRPAVLVTTGIESPSK